MSVRKMLAVAFLPMVAIRPTFIAFEADMLTQRNAAIFSTTTAPPGWMVNILLSCGTCMARLPEPIIGWKLVDALNLEQAATELTVTRARLGAAYEPRHYRDLDDRLEGKNVHGELVKF